MKKIFLATIAAMITAFSANAQVKIESPHPDLEVKITRCSYASGKVVIDMTLTNFGTDMEFNTRGSGVTAYDDEGNAYNSKNAKVLLGLVSQGLKTSATYVLPQDVPMKFRIQLDGISADASKFPILKFSPHYSSYDHNVMGINKDSYVTIRNLEWVK